MDGREGGGRERGRKGRNEGKMEGWREVGMEEKPCMPPVAS